MMRKYFTAIHIVIFFVVSHGFAAEQNPFAKSEIGQRSLNYLKSMQISTPNQALSMGLNVLNTVVCAATYVAMPPEVQALDLLCNFDPNTTWTSMSSNFFTNLKSTAASYTKFYSHNKRAEFIRMIEKAYSICEASHPHNDPGYHDLERILFNRVPDYQDIFKGRQDIPLELAQKLVLANEAGHFSCWSALFPENPPNSAHERPAAFNGSPFVFSFAAAGNEELKHLDRHFIDTTTADGQQINGSYFAGVDILDILKMDYDQLMNQKAMLQEIHKKYQAAVFIFAQQN